MSVFRMSTNEFEAQPVQDPSNTDSDLPSDRPQEKSNVPRNPNAPDQKAAFGKQDHVHMAILNNGVRKKGNFTIYQRRYNKPGAYWEYQLMDTNDRLHKNGAWIRERDFQRQ